MTIAERRDYLIEIRELLKKLQAEKGVTIFDFHEEDLSGFFIPDPYLPFEEKLADLQLKGSETPIAVLEEVRSVVANENPEFEEKSSHGHSDDEVIVESKISFHSSLSPTLSTSEQHFSSKLPKIESMSQSTFQRIHSGLSSTDRQPERLPMIPNVFAISSDKSGYRVYPWGTVETENANHSDVPRLRSLVFEKGFINQLRNSTQQFTRKVYQQQKKKILKGVTIKYLFYALGCMLVLLGMGFFSYSLSSISSKHRYPVVAVTNLLTKRPDGNFR